MGHAGSGNKGELEEEHGEVNEGGKVHESGEKNLGGRVGTANSSGKHIGK
jgi:hypothetical protein